MSALHAVMSDEIAIEKRIRSDLKNAEYAILLEALQLARVLKDNPQLDKLRELIEVRTMMNTSYMAQMRHVNSLLAQRTDEVKNHVL